MKALFSVVSNSTRRDSEQKLELGKFHINTMKNLFTVRVIEHWNRLWSLSLCRYSRFHDSMISQTINAAHQCCSSTLGFASVPSLLSVPGISLPGSGRSQQILTASLVRIKSDFKV